MVTYGPWQDGFVQWETLRFGSAYTPGAPGTREVHGGNAGADSGLRSFRQVAVTSIRQGRTGATVRFPTSPTQWQIEDASDQAYNLDYQGFNRTYTYPAGDNGAGDPWANYPTAGASLTWNGSGMAVGYDTVMELDGLAWVKDYQKANIAPSTWPDNAVGIEYRPNYEVEFIDATAYGWAGTPEERQGDATAPWTGGNLDDWTCYRKDPGSGFRFTDAGAWMEDPADTLTLANGTGGQATYDYWLGKWGPSEPITEQLNALKIPRVGLDPTTGQPIGVAWDSGRGVWYNTANPADTYTAKYSNPANRLEWTWGPNGDTITTRDIAIGTIVKRLTQTTVTVELRWRSAPYRFVYDTAPTGLPPLRQHPRRDGLGASTARRHYPPDRSVQASNRHRGGFY